MDLIHQITSIERSGHRNIVHGMYCEECDLRIGNQSDSRPDRGACFAWQWTPSHAAQQ
jgi:hypothetical protein